MTQTTKPDRPRQSVSRRRSQQQLAAIWFVSVGVILLIVVIQTTLGKFGNNARDVWGWLLPNVMPTLSLIIAVMSFEGTQRARDRQVDSFLFQLARGVSIAYVALVLLTVLAEPFSTLEASDLRAQASLWLGPLQGLVAGILGVFFTREDPASRGKATPANP